MLGSIFSPNTPRILICLLVLGSPRLIHQYAMYYISKTLIDFEKKYTPLEKTCQIRDFRRQIFWYNPPLWNCSFHSWGELASSPFIQPELVNSMTIFHSSESELKYSWNRGFSLRGPGKWEWSQRSCSDVRIWYLRDYFLTVNKPLIITNRKNKKLKNNK